MTSFDLRSFSKIVVRKFLIPVIQRYSAIPQICTHCTRSSDPLETLEVPKQKFEALTLLLYVLDALAHQDKPVGKLSQLCPREGGYQWHFIPSEGSVRCFHTSLHLVLVCFTLSLSLRPLYYVLCFFLSY
ncbi:uncharacterized protein LOC130777821 [Actinidia eriantha]|uniref:uncharacterized protein LOC130777821 n=1 Tax=Actinidia eriantha TaxID=165200 RepID=UPI00258C683A|nr:uncharacterized protein LOC130777821 [Actinidia eriantha]